MSASHGNSVILLQEKLKTFFKEYRRVSKRCDELSEKCTPHLIALTNMSQRLQACKKLGVNVSGLNKIPDYGEQLIMTIQADMNLELVSVGVQIDAMFGCVRELQLEWSRIFQWYHKQNIPLCEITVENPPKPALARQLELAQDTTNYFLANYLIKKHCLSTIGYLQLSSITRLRQSFLDPKPETPELEDLNSLLPFILGAT